MNKIIAHRGIYNNINIPENSIPAFKRALKLNYPIELDVNITKDNVLVVFHDNNLLRMTGVNKNINDVTYKEIKELSLLNTKEKIPTLSEVLNLTKGKVMLLIEIKKSNKYKILTNKLINILNNYKCQYIIQSFDDSASLILLSPFK